MDFANEVNPIFVKHCTACHGGVKDAGGINFIYREKALAIGDSGNPAIKPGSPSESELIRRIKLPADHDERMPEASHGPPLTQSEIALLEQWITEGADWSGHWSFTPIQANNHTIDQHIRDSLPEHNLSPAPPASRAEWLRRVTLDLTGLLPTPSELDAFESDPSPQAFENTVDRLLASPHYGERWASVWLDLARYADSEGLGQDQRREVYPFRNWVINAFQNDLPYNEFTLKQLAGDLLPKRNLDDLIATGFHRLTAHNSEGGTDDEEFRVAAVMDRVATTYNVWQGLTMECVQCHSHPYDPILHTDYFRTYALFNSTTDADQSTHDTSIRIPYAKNKQAETLNNYNQLAAAEEQLLIGTLALNKTSTWHPPIQPKFTTSNSSLRAETRKTTNGQPDFFALGTHASSARHNLTFQTSPSLQTLSALRLTILPEDLAQARHLAEAGFSLRHLKLTRTTSDGTTTPVTLQQVFVHNQSYLEDPNNLLNPDSNLGWSVQSKIFHPHSATLVLTEPLTLQPSSQLQLQITHTGRRGNQGSVPLVVRRFQIHLTDNPDWLQSAISPDRLALKKQINQLKQKLNNTEGPRALVMKEREPALTRETRLFERGNWLTRGETIAPGTPQSIQPNKLEVTDRLQLAEWLTSHENPLTARVWANRLWHQLFGLGLVETLEDFGAAGVRPRPPPPPPPPPPQTPGDNHKKNRPKKKKRAPPQKTKKPKKKKKTP
ncbi:MAG: DUF1549 domain-containing protein, partial [Verrucomicrobiota bacterium]